MSLKELEKDLQRQKSKIAEREHNTTAYNEWQSKEEENKESVWQKIKDKMQDTRIKAIVIGGIIVSVIVFALFSAASFVYFQSGFFAQERVTLVMEAPQNTKSNQLSSIVFMYENDNRANLSAAEIIVQFGEYFVPEENQDGFTRVSDNQGVINLGMIKGGKKDEFILAGHFVGPRDSIADVAGTLRYMAESTSARYDTTARSSTMITSSPVEIDIDSPNEIVSGNLLDIVIKVQNTSKDTLSDVKLTFDVPDNFSLYNTEPRVSHGNMWLIDQLEPQSEKIFHVRGGLDAPVGSVQKFSAEVGTQESVGTYVTYANILYAPRIIQSPILVKQIMESVQDGVVRAGDRMNYYVQFTNNSDTPLRDVIVTLNMDGDAVDFGSLELNDKGDYDQENRRIVWKAADVPDLRLLEPNESGEVSFAVDVKRQLPVNDENDHHFSVTSVAAIDSEDIPSQLRENKAVLSNALIIPVAAKVILGSTSEYVSGEEPPKVGEKTIYKITMKVDSINNDIANTIVHIPLPTHSTFEGGASDGITFNERTNDVVWDAGTILHGTGVISDSREASFNVGIVPSVEQINDSMDLIKKQMLTAMDNFADIKIEETAVLITTESDGRFGIKGIIQP